MDFLIVFVMTVVLLAVVNAILGESSGSRASSSSSMKQSGVTRFNSIKRKREKERRYFRKFGGL